jgi:hypothetical protein
MRIGLTAATPLAEVERIRSLAPRTSHSSHCETLANLEGDDYNAPS